MIHNKHIPLSLYIHIPWCVNKCPYCDFYSISDKSFPEKQYIDCLIRDLANCHDSRDFNSIFIGGGTPSLFSPKSFDRLFNAIFKKFNLKKDIEITVEANPETFDLEKIKAYRALGINRLSVGVQSFQDKQLKLLGRIHHAKTAKNAINMAKKAGFENINIDLMFGLPQQTIPDVLTELKTAIELSPTHLSWYQLTIEPNTPFSQTRPQLPDEEILLKMQEVGQAYLAQQGLNQYEISAYAKKEFQCQHNLNYWTFGDYIGIGASAHSKITNDHFKINRRAVDDNVKKYLSSSVCFGEKVSALPLEFMMNALRLTQGFSLSLFEQRTGLPINTIKKQIRQAINEHYITIENDQIKPTRKGFIFLNQVLHLFA